MWEPTWLTRKRLTKCNTCRNLAWSSQRSRRIRREMSSSRSRSKSIRWIRFSWLKRRSKSSTWTARYKWLSRSRRILGRRPLTQDLLVRRIQWARLITRRSRTLSRPNPLPATVSTRSKASRTTRIPKRHYSSTARSLRSSAARSWANPGKYQGRELARNSTARRNQIWEPCIDIRRRLLRNRWRMGIVLGRRRPHRTWKLPRYRTTRRHLFSRLNRRAWAILTMRSQWWSRALKATTASKSSLILPQANNRRVWSNR